MILITNKGFSMVEALIATMIMGLVAGGGFLLLTAGRANWYTSDAAVALQQNLRQAVQRVTVELRETQLAQQQIFNAAGPNNTDVIRFSIPVICEAGNLLLDVNGDVVYWGASLNWGCSDSTCMDADNNCSTVDYKYIEYRINNSDQLVRRVLDNGGTLVTENVFAQNITDFQMALNGSVITLQVSSGVTSDDARTLSAQTSTDVFLRN